MADPLDGAAARPPRVDAHAHIFTRQMPYAPDAHSVPDYDYPVEAWLAEMARHGITHGVIAAASMWGDYNDYTLAALAAYPNLRGSVILSPETPAATLRDLADRGVVGVRLTWRRLNALPDPAAERWLGFLRRLADAGLHAELLASGEVLPALLPRFLASGVNLVIDHFGVPPHDPAPRAGMHDALAAALENGRAWVKISAGFRVPEAIAAECTARLLADAGPERLIWGSDAPFVNHEASMDYPAALALYERLVPDAATRAAIDETAFKFYF